MLQICFFFFFLIIDLGAFISCESYWLMKLTLLSVFGCPNPIKTYQFIADHLSATFVKFSILLQVSFSLFGGQKTNHIVVSSLIRNDFEVKLLFKLINVLNERSVTCFSFIWVASYPSQVMYYGIRLVNPK